MLELILAFDPISLTLLAISAGTAIAGGIQQAQASGEQRDNINRQNDLVKGQEPIFKDLNRQIRERDRTVAQRDKQVAQLNTQINSLQFQQTKADAIRARRQLVRDSLILGGDTAVALTSSGAGLGSTAVSGALAQNTTQFANRSFELRNNFQRALDVRNKNREIERRTRRFNSLLSRQQAGISQSQSAINSSNRQLQLSSGAIQQNQADIAQGQQLFNTGLQIAGSIPTASRVLQTTFNQPVSNNVLLSPFSTTITRS